MTILKQCPHCTIKPIDEFGFNRAKSDGRQSLCSECRRAVNAAYYQRTKLQYNPTRIATAAAKRAEHTSILFEYLSSHPCAECGETDVMVLEFDHLRDKIKDVTEMIGGNTEKLLAEMAKCQVLCANCHRRKSFKGSWRDRGSVA